MKINYFAILNASLNKAVFVLNLSKKQRLVRLTTLNICFFKCMKIGYFVILNASLNKAVFFVFIKKQFLVPLKILNDWFFKRYEY
jgi:hypothetical protein